MEISKVLDPIGEGLAGSDVRYDPLFDALQSEVEKLVSPSFTGRVDWEGVVELASDILAKKSKDLMVTSYLAVALIHTRKQDGVLTSLRIFHDVLKKFWDELYPVKEKARARVLCVEWWLDKMLKALHGVRLSSQQAPAALALVEKIDALLTEQLPGAPSVEPLRRHFAEPEGGAEPRTTAEPSPPAPDQAPSEAEGAAQEEAAPAGVEPEEEKGDGDLDGDLEGALQRGLQMALHLRRSDPANPLPYRLLRNAMWSFVSELPPALEGRTRIPAPERRQVELLRDLRQKRAWEALLDASEVRLSQYIFWLDLNRMSYEALEHLGEPFRAPQEAIAQETGHLVRRLGRLAELSFSDGTPFADADTRRWLRQVAGGGREEGARLEPGGAPHSLNGAGAGTLATTSTPPPQSAPGERPDLVQALEEAKLLSREGKLVDAVDRLHRKVEECRPGRERLLWRLTMVEFLLRGSSSRLLLAQLDQVLAEVERYGLAWYDPPLALRAFKLAYLGFNAADDPVFKEKGRAALFRIGQLDPVEMVRLEKGEPTC